jgi:two-component system CheB/CheR fusion protein
VAEGDVALRDLLDRLLRGEGHRTLTAPDAKAELGISQRTVENHCASIVKRTGTISLPALARLAMAAAAG